MGKFNLDSSLSDLLQNPLAADIIERFVQDKGIPQTLLTRGKLQRLTLRQLIRITLPLYDDERLEQYIDNINAYDEQLLGDTPCEPVVEWWKETIYYRLYCETAEELAHKLPQLHLLSVETIWLNSSPKSCAELDSMLHMLHQSDKKLIVTAVNLQQAQQLLDRGINGIAICIGDNSTMHETMRSYSLNCFNNYNNIVTIGFLSDVGYERTKLLTCENRGELNMVYGNIGNPDKPYDFNRLKQYIVRNQQLPDNCWSALCLDEGTRMLHRLQPRWLYKDRVAEMLAVLMMTLKGSPILRQGQEYGLSGERPRPKDDNYKNGVFECYSKLIGIRKEHKAFVYGKFLPVFSRDKNYFCYFRVYNGERYYIECNITERTINRRGEITKMVPLYCSYGDFTSLLRPFEANIYKVTQ